MKLLATIILILLITVMPSPGMGAVSTTDERALPEDITSIMPITENRPATGLNEQAPVASALDLSLFSIISLGVLGLFWIRRHTSEL